MKGAVQLKNETYIAGLWVSQGSRQLQASNLQLGLGVFVTKTKTQVWEVFGETKEQDLASSLEKFRQTVCHLRKGESGTHTVFSVGGEMLASTESRGQRWKEYFADLLNPTNIPRRGQNRRMLG